MTAAREGARSTRIELAAFGRMDKNLLRSRLSCRAKVLWAHLDEQSPVRTAHSRSQLVQVLNCSLRSLDRVIEELEDSGWLTVTRTRSDSGTNLANIFTLSKPPREIGPVHGVRHPEPVVTGATIQTGHTGPVHDGKRPSPVATGATTPLRTGARGDLRTGGNQVLRDEVPRRKPKESVGGGTHVSSRADSPAPPRCSKHPDGPRHDENCRACGLVRMWEKEHQEPDPDVLAGRRKAQAIRDCTRCDQGGWLPSDHESPARHCAHDDALNAAAGGRSVDPGTAYLRAMRAKAASA